MLDGVDLVVALAHDYSVETRVRRLIDAHYEAGTPPKMLVMNEATLSRLEAELEGVRLNDAYYWVPQGNEPVTFYLGVPILVKDYVADMEVIVGV